LPQRIKAKPKIELPDINMPDISGFNKLNVPNLSFKVSDMNLFGLG